MLRVIAICLQSCKCCLLDLCFRSSEKAGNSMVLIKSTTEKYLPYLQVMINVCLHDWFYIYTIQVYKLCKMAKCNHILNQRILLLSVFSLRSFNIFIVTLLRTLLKTIVLFSKLQCFLCLALNILSCHLLSYISELNSVLFSAGLLW